MHLFKETLDNSTALFYHVTYMYRMWLFSMVHRYMYLCIKVYLDERA
jgi:hypothetical protein